MFQFFANIFGYLLNFINNFVGNYGLAIIMFTILIKIIMLPLSIKQQRTMKKSSELQEKMKVLQFKYKNDPEKLNREMMDLYKKENMSPFSGCLSTIIQFILLISIFYMVRCPLTYMEKIDKTQIESYVQQLKDDGMPVNQAYSEIDIIREVDYLKEKFPEDENLEKILNKSKEYLEKHDVTIVPLSVSFDGEIYYRDGVDITRDQCYQKMVDDPKLFPKTSLPSVESYADVFRSFVEQGFPVVCFTITTLFSGSYNSAMNAKSLVEEDYPDANICVIDSKQNTVTQALLIDQFVKMLEDGLSFEQAMSKLDALMASARIFFTVGSLDYLKMGGRIGKVATAATGKLGVKPVIIMKDGDIVLFRFNV